MEASAVPRLAPAGAFMSPHLLRLASDARLVALIREGRSGAFEVVYDRHHRGILSFCRHMLGDPQEAEDAVQHTFLSAYNDLISSHKPIHLRAWLFAIARNRCYSILRSRRDQPAADIDEAATEGLATQVQRRQDLRDLVLDMRRLPDEQRAALVLAELDSLSHEQIGEALGVPREKVKALVFQARESLVASRTARETDCAEIREQLATQRGGALRRANLRRHLRECAGCRDFRNEIERQRRQLAALLPVVPTIALKEGVLAGTIGGGATASVAGGGFLASTVLKSGLVKVIVGAIVAGAGTAGTIAATNGLHIGGHRTPSVDRPAVAVPATVGAPVVARPFKQPPPAPATPAGQVSAQPASGAGGAGLLGSVPAGGSAPSRGSGLSVGGSHPTSGRTGTAPPLTGGTAPAAPAPATAPPPSLSTGSGAGHDSAHHHGGSDPGSGGTEHRDPGATGGSTRGEGGGAYTGGAGIGSPSGSGDSTTGGSGSDGSGGSTGTGPGDTSGGSGSGDTSGSGSGTDTGSGTGTDGASGSGSTGGSDSGSGSGSSGSGGSGSDGSGSGGSGSGGSSSGGSASGSGSGGPTPSPAVDPTAAPTPPATDPTAGAPAAGA